MMLAAIDFMPIDHPNMQLIDHINIIKSECERKYSDDSNKLLMSLRDQIINHINYSMTNKTKESTDIYVLKDFPWISRTDAKFFILNLTEKCLKENIHEFSESSVYKKWIEQEPAHLIAEFAFGSYTKEIQINKNKGKPSKTVANRIDVRRKLILKWINSQSFTNKQCSEYWKVVVGLISEEMRMVSINHLNERVAGWQRDWNHNDESIQETPFWAIKDLSSTRARLILIQNWDKIIRHPNFLYQKLLKDSYGISITKSKASMSKYFI